MWDFAHAFVRLFVCSRTQIHAQWTMESLMLHVIDWQDFLNTHAVDPNAALIFIGFCIGRKLHTPDGRLLLVQIFCEDDKVQVAPQRIFPIAMVLVWERRCCSSLLITPSLVPRNQLCTRVHYVKLHPR